MSSGRLCWKLGKTQREVRSVLWMLELSELYVLTFNIGMFCPPKALPSGGGRPPGRWTGRVPSLCILVTPEIFLPQKSEGNLASGDNLAQNSARPVEAARTCTHKIAIGDSDLINVRIGPLCGESSRTSRKVREVPLAVIAAIRQSGRYGISRRDAASLRLDVRRTDHLCPLLG